jgi:hypothetical protein
MASQYKVKEGECLASIAEDHNFADFRAIYDHPQNARFKRDHPNPNVIMPGDVLFIPDKRQNEVSRSVGQKHLFEFRRSKIMLRLRLQNWKGKSLANKEYELKLDDETLYGTTDAQGRIEQAIPVKTLQAELSVRLDVEEDTANPTWLLEIGYLHPVKYLTGVQARLANLNLYFGKVDGINGPLTELAVKAFQQQYGLDVDGIPGPKTQTKLEEVHGC